MTNEEFTGHLLAAMHGPKAEEIAARVLEVVGTDALMAELGGMLAGILSRVSMLESYATCQDPSIGLTVGRHREASIVSRTMLDSIRAQAIRDASAGVGIPLDVLRKAGVSEAHIDDALRPPAEGQP